MVAYRTRLWELFGHVLVTIKQWKLVMNLIMALGLLLVFTGIGLLAFTDMATEDGVSGVRNIALLIGAGLVLLIPAKLFLTLLLMGGSEKRDEPSNQP